MGRFDCFAQATQVVGGGKGPLRRCSRAGLEELREQGGQNDLVIAPLRTQAQGRALGDVL
ncbi:hypothetical protein D3C78_1811480 [compost metagenome]